MKHFIRLLLISFGLLILLGINEKQSNNSKTDTLSISTGTFLEFCVCTPASAAVESAEGLTAAALRQLPEHFQQI